MIKLVAPLFVLVLLFGSCSSFHQGTTSGGSAVVTNNEYSHIEYAYGTARATNVLGIGGNDKEGLVLEAKRNLLRNYPLSETQAIGQTTVDYKTTFFLFIFWTQVTLSAEIIDYGDGKPDYEKRQKHINKFTNSHVGSEFLVGSSVFFKKRSKIREATVIGIQDDLYVLKYYDDDNNLRIARVDGKRLILDEEVEYQRIEPSEGDSPDNLYTPKNPKGRLVKFRYKGKEYVGELVERKGNNFLIMMEDAQGKKTGLYINKQDIIE